MTAKRQYRILGAAMMAAALVLGMTACSSENDLAGEPTVEEPTAQTQATIHVTVGAGISDGEATTRSTVDYSGGTRTLQFSAGDKLYVWGHYGDEESEPSGMTYYPYIVAGYLALDTESFDDSDPTNATFTGDLTVYRWVNEEGSGEGVDYMVYDNGYYDPVSPSGIFSTADPLADFQDVTALLIHEDAAENANYVINDRYEAAYNNPNACAATVEALMTTGLVVSGSYNAGTKSFTLGREGAQPIVNCTIAGLEGSTDYQFVLKKGAAVATSVGWTTDAGGTASFAFISRMTGSAEWTLDVTKGGSTVGSIDLGSRALGATVYNVSRLWTSSGFVKTRVVNLTGMTNYYGAQNGDILTGTMPSDKELFIADGATVILRDATVNSSKYIGINCRDVTIILEGENTVSSIYSGINIYPGTLTIQGSGSLTVTGGGDYAGICGNSSNSHLVIKGGTIVAQGGTSSNYSGAGIGSKRDGQFGTITITGGDVTATGGANAAGIGCGSQGTCGDITISGGTVRATGGSTSGSGIGGTGDNGRCGNITISGGTVTATSNSAETPAIGNSTTNNGTCVTITSGITSVAMTSNSEYGTWKKVWYFLQDQTISIDGVNIPNYGNANIVGSYGTVGSVYDYSTKTWTLYK